MQDDLVLLGCATTCQKVTKADQYCDHVCSEWLLCSTDSALIASQSPRMLVKISVLTGNMFPLWREEI